MGGAVYFVGVDGGGTKTAVCVLEARRRKEDDELGISSSGEEVVYLDDEHTLVCLATCTVGGSNQNSVGNEAAKREVINGITSVLGLAMAPIEHGVDRPADQIVVQEWLKEVFDPERVVFNIHSDAVGALASGTRGLMHGAVLIAGTGMISMAFRDGKRARSFGWGYVQGRKPLIGEPGSGYWLGTQALRAVARAEDGVGPQTTLKEKDTKWERFGVLAPLVLQAAQEGDAVACSIVDQAIAEYCEGLRSAVERVGFEKESCTIVLAGGLLTHENSILAARLRDTLPTIISCTVTLPVLQAEQSSALIAYQRVKDALVHSE